MDQPDSKAGRIASHVDHQYFCENQDMRNEKGSSNSGGKSNDANSVLEKQQLMSNEEIQSCEAEISSKMERYPAYAHVAASHYPKGDDANNLKTHLSAVSTSRSLGVELQIYEKESCTEQTSMSACCSNGFASSAICSGHAHDGNQKNIEISVHSMEGTDSAPHIPVKSDVTSETGLPLNGTNYVSDGGRASRNWINAGEESIKSTIHAPLHETLLKTESSASNSAHAFHPVSSSNDSNQETSVEAKSFDHCGNGVSNFIYSGFKCTVKEPAAGSALLGMAAQITQKAVENVRARDDKKVLEIIGDHKSSIVEEVIDNQTTYQPGKKNAELVSQRIEDLSNELDDALEVAWKVAREVEQKVGIYNETSGSSSSNEKSNGEAVHRSSVDSADTNRNCSPETGGVKLCSEQNNPNGFCSNEKVADPKSPMENKHFLAAYGPSKQMDPAIMHETSDGPYGLEPAKLPGKPEIVAAVQIPLLSRFDLNQDIQENEVEYPNHAINETVSSHNAINMSTPIHVVAKSGVPTSLPGTLLKFEGEQSWRGPTATSAFRSTSLSKNSNGKRTSSISDNCCSSNHLHAFTGIDLNVAAAADDSAIEILPSENVAKFSIQDGSKQAGRPNIDLNHIGENESSLVSLSRSFTADFDLNDDPLVVDISNGACQQGLCSQPLRNKALANPAVSLLGDFRPSDFNCSRPANLVNFTSLQGISHGRARPFLLAPKNVLPSVQHMEQAVPLQPKFPHMPQTLPFHAYPYNNGFYVGPANPLSSTALSSGALPYVAEPLGTAISPRILGPGAHSTFPRPLHLMEVVGVPNASDIMNVRPNFDVYGGACSSENGKRGGNVGQFLYPEKNILMEEQMKSFQPVAVSATPMKRREPEGGWEAYQVGHKQVTSWL